MIIWFIWNFLKMIQLQAVFVFEIEIIIIYLKLTLPNIEK